MIGEEVKEIKLPVCI